MARPRKIPDVNQLLTWREQGWTHQRMAEHIYETTGELVSRSTISAALSRAGKSSNKPRYKDVLPWRVREIHAREYPARMLRALGRRLAGTELDERDDQRLESWLTALADANAVVGYDPDNDKQGFHYIDPSGDDGSDGIPIHRQRIWTVI